MNLQIYDEASDWVVKHRNGGLQTREKKLFDAWLRESPHHLRAYLEMSSVWDDVPQLDPTWNPSAEELIARAQGDANVVPLSTPTAPTPTAEHRPPPKWRGRIAYATAASLAIALAASWAHRQRDTYTTDIGEQRLLTLTDGSTIDLNSSTRVKVHYTGHERHIDLLQGQALFHAAKDTTRPFVVRADQTEVRALGTAFDIYKARTGTVVTVVEGKVAVSAPTAQTPETPNPNVVLTAGDQIKVTQATVTTAKQPDLATATAWTRHSLVFEASPLTDVAQEFNRYNKRRLVVEDPQLAEFHVSGVFSSVEPSLLLRFLRAQPELDVEERDTEIRISKK